MACALNGVRLKGVRSKSWTLVKSQNIQSIVYNICLLSGQHAGQSDVRLRRRLSDKDKHRLVRRSSSKKNKENGSESTSGESGKGGDNAEPAKDGGGGGHTPVLKRTTSADSSSSNSHNQHHHAILARTRSEEGGQGASPGPGASPASGASDLIARSLPRI